MISVIASVINALKKDYCGQDPLYKVLADGIYVAVVIEKTIPLGTPFPSHLKLVKDTDISLNWVRQMMALLKKRGIIETRKSGGSWIVSVLPENPGLVWLKRKLREADGTRVTLNSGDFVDSYIDPVGFNELLNIKKKMYSKLSAELCKPRDIVGLMEGCAQLVSGSSGTRFYEGEVALVPDGNLVLIAICKKFMSATGRLVMPQGSLKAKKEVIREVKKNIEMVRAEEKGIDMEDLERICARYNNIEVFYLDLTSPVCPDYFSAPEWIKKLFLLQRKYKFLIVIEYNPDAVFSKSFHRDFFNCNKESVLLIRAYSLYDAELKRWNIVAASKKIISGLERVLATKGGRIAPELGLAAFNIMAEGDLEKGENKVKELMFDLRKQIINELTKSQLWRPKYIEGSTGNFFLLEPLKGILPENIKEQLAAVNIDVMDSSLYDLNVKHRKGILIGIGSYAEPKAKLKDIRMLHKYVQKMIIGSED